MIISEQIVQMGDERDERRRGVPLSDDALGFRPPRLSRVRARAGGSTAVYSPEIIVSRSPIGGGFEVGGPPLIGGYDAPPSLPGGGAVPVAVPVATVSPVSSAGGSALRDADEVSAVVAVAARRSWLVWLWWLLLVLALVWLARRVRL